MGEDVQVCFQISPAPIKTSLPREFENVSNFLPVSLKTFSNSWTGELKIGGGI